MGGDGHEDRRRIPASPLVRPRPTALVRPPPGGPLRPPDAPGGSRPRRTAHDRCAPRLMDRSVRGDIRAGWLGDLGAPIDLCWFSGNGTILLV